MELNNKAKEFIENLKLIRDWNPYCIFVQAYHESGAFCHIIGNWNCWGIKKPKNWLGPILTRITSEYEPVESGELVDDAKSRLEKKYGKQIESITRDGNLWKISLPQPWIDFETCLEAISWFCGLIEQVYPESFINRNDPMKYFKGLVSGRYRYATDPNYVNKLIALYNFLKVRIKL